MSAAARMPHNEGIDMAQHQQRVIDEKAELDERLGKLKAEIDKVNFSISPDAEMTRMLRQFSAMQHLSEILGERIAEF